MITPAGKVRHQINQGPYKNESLWNSEILNKFAVTGVGLDQKGGYLNQVKPDVNPDLQDAMNQSNSAAISGKVPGSTDGRMPGEKEAPADLGVDASPRGSPASKFLRSNPDDNPDDQNANISTQMIFNHEQNKIRKFIGNDFGLDMKYNKDGSITVKITPPQQIPIAKPQQFIDELMRYLQGAEQKNLVSPPANQPGPISVTYTPRALLKVKKP